MLTLDDAVSALRAARSDGRARQDPSRAVDSFPTRVGLERVVDLLAAALYPRRLGGFRGADAQEDGFVAAKLIAAFADLPGEPCRNDEQQRFESEDERIGDSGAVDHQSGEIGQYGAEESAEGGSLVVSGAAGWEALPQAAAIRTARMTRAAWRR